MPFVQMHKGIGASVVEPLAGLTYRREQMRRTTAIAMTAATAATYFVVPAAAQEPGSSITVGNTAIGGGKVTVTGAVSYAQDAVGPVVVATDAAADASQQGAGLDIKDLSMQTLLKAKKVVFTMGINDGLAAPVDGNAPSTGYHWPIVVDAEDRYRWLGGGSAGTNFPPRTAKWVGVCENEAAGGGTEGWSCPGSIVGGITATAVRWELPFKYQTGLTPIAYGSTIEGSGGVYCGVPCSWPWPSVVVGAAAPSDFADAPAVYKVPGEIKLGIAPAGTAVSGVDFSSTGTFSASDESAGTFSGTVNAPAAAGTYTVWAKTCYGIDGGTCAIASRDITL